MQLQAPAGLDDFDENEGPLRTKFQTLWNGKERSDGYLGYYVAADPELPNYVDPRDKAPESDPVQVPWNGFPKMMSRWFGDETSAAAREEAEAAADTLGYLVYWVQPDPRDRTRLATLSCPSHQLPFFASVYGPHVLKLARSRCIVLPNGKVSPPFLEQYRQQDEYLEWHAEEDANGKLTSLTFTAEPPDYWEALAEVSPAKVLALYKSIVSPQVQEADLFFQGDVVAAGIDQNGNVGWFRTPQRKGDYNPLNVWTTSRGIMHLTHPANTLGAEVRLAKEASAVRDCDALPPPTPKEPQAEVRRIACGGYGGINRSSDPLIGLGVGAIVNDGTKLSLTDPVGLYIAECVLDSLKGPQNQVVVDAKTTVRGHDDPTEPRIVRLHVAIKAGSAFVLGDCTLEGRPLRRGGQVARLTGMALYAQTYTDAADPTSGPCDGIPCRNPSHMNLFVAGDPAKACPKETDPIWLLETPYLEKIENLNFAFPGASNAVKALAAGGNTEFFSAKASLGQLGGEELNNVVDTEPAEAPMPSRAPF